MILFGKTIFLFFLTALLIKPLSTVASSEQDQIDAGYNFMIEQLIIDTIQLDKDEGIFAGRLDSILFDSVSKYFKSDLKASVENLKELTKTGDSMAHFFLGMLYYYGVGVERNIPKSLIHNEFANNEFSELVLMNQIKSGEVTPPSCSYSLRIHRSIFDKNKNNLQILFTDTPKIPIITDINNLEYIRDKFILDVNKHHFILQSGKSGGDPNLIIELGKRYLIGDILHTDNYNKAIELFEMARDAGSPHANSYIGLAYTLKYFVTKDNSFYDKALEIFDKEMIENNSPIAYLGFSISKYLRSSEITDEEKVAAFDLLKKATNFSRKWVHFLYGIFYLEGFGVKPDHQKALTYIESAFINFNIPAAAYLAKLNDYGVGTFEDCHLSIKLYSIVLNVMLFRNAKIRAFEQIINGDPQKSFYMMLTLAYFGDSDSLYNIASLLNSKYLQISDKPAHDRFIFQFYSLAATNNIKEAWEKIGDCYYSGIGVEQNYIEAESAYKNGIDYLNARSAFMVGVLYQFGVDGIEKDVERAQLYFEKAIELNPAAYYPIKLWTLQIDIGEYLNVLTKSIFNFFVHFNTQKLINLFLLATELKFIEKISFCFSMFVFIFWIYVYRNRIAF